MSETRKNRLITVQCPGCGEKTHHLKKSVLSLLAVSCPHCRKTFDVEEVPDRYAPDEKKA